MITIRLKLDGNLSKKGFRVNLEIKADQTCIEKLGNLAPNPELEQQLTEHWQGYRKFYAPYHRGIKPLEIDVGTQQFDGQTSAQELIYNFNQWLNHPIFQNIDQLIREQLRQEELYQLIIQTNDNRLLKLPWGKWNLFAKINDFVVTFSPIESQSQRLAEISKIKRVLAILGHKEGINLGKDRQSLKNWTKQQIEFLDEPTLQELYDHLYKQSWDMIFFAGHSETIGDQGQIYLNSHESLTMKQLENAMKEAQKKGLKVAIFNSCDGIGLAKQLEVLDIAYIIVMRELIPDQVAHHFLIYFLENFTQGQSFEISLHQAQRRLQGLETQFPCATWLPLIYHKPHTPSPIWEKVFSPYQELGKTLGKSILATLIIMGLRWIGIFQGLELMAYDMLMKQRPSEIIDDRITVVEITDNDLDRYYQPILPDPILQAAIAKLDSYNPRVIGIDIHRNDNKTRERDQLINFITQNSHVIPVCSFDNPSISYKPHRNLPTQQLGFSDLILDSDDKVRRQLITYDPSLNDDQSLCVTPYSLSWQLAYRYLKQDNIQPLTTTEQGQWQFGKVVFPKLTTRFGGYQNLDGKANQMMINYHSNGKVGQRMTLSDLLDDQFSGDYLEDKIILLGYTSSYVMVDQADTPIGQLPGVWIHANMTSQMISAVLDGRSLIRVFPQWGDAIWVLSWSIIAGILMWGLKTYSPKYAIFSSVLSMTILSLVLYSVVRFSLSKGLWLPWIPTQLVLLLILVIMLIPRFSKKIL